MEDVHWLKHPKETLFVGFEDLLHLFIYLFIHVFIVRITSLRSAHLFIFRNLVGCNWGGNWGATGGEL